MSDTKAFILALPLMFLGGASYADKTPLVPFDHGTPVESSSISVAGQDTKIWQTSAANHQLTLKPAEPSTLPNSDTFYLEVTYLDRGYGRLAVTYQGNDGKMDKPDKFTQVVLSDSGKWMTSHLRLSGVAASGIPDIQVGLEKNKDNVLILSGASLQNRPFDDPHFQYILAEAWKRPYDGPTTPGIDNQTLKGKVMVGYQGWFRTPNDPSNEGWVHWGDMSRGQFNTDMWPDVSGYPPEALDKAADVKTLSGKPGYLFSSAWPEVVRTHFHWMHENDIDGAFVQRFLGGLYAVNGHPEWVLGNVRAAANQEGRIWAVEYDVSGCSDAKLLDTLKTDWAWMVDDFGIRTDPSYAHEGGKPVVFIWGMGVSDRGISPATANAVIDFFKNDPKYGGNYVIGGISSQWRKMDSTWQEHFHHYDGILGWMSKTYVDDVKDFKAMGVDYYPHAWPGFSWANLKHLPTGATEQFTPRQGGRYFENLFSQAAQAGVDRLFVGMFDEYDESTAIIPMSDDPPPTPSRPGTVVKFFPMPGVEEHAVTVSKSQVEVAFDGTAPAKGIAPENFSMKWEGQIIVPTDGEYKLKVEGPEGDSWSLWINEKRLITVKSPAPGAGAGASSSRDQVATVSLTASTPAIYRLDYTHTSTPGTMRLLWSGPSPDFQEIPPSAFVDAWGRFLTNEGNPPDFWLKLTTEAKAMIAGRRSATELSIKAP